MSFPISIREQHGLRTLHFSSERIQGAMLIERPWELALEYTREMMAALLLRKGGSVAAGHPPATSLRGLRKGGLAGQFPREVLLIGLGAGSQAKFLYRHFPHARLTVVEIEPCVVDAAREHFMLPVDPDRLEITIADGYEYMHATDRQFDLILIDGFNQYAHPGDLNTRPFYEACRKRLSGQGVLAVNLIGLCRGVKGGFAYIEEAFDQRAVLFPRCDSGNTIAFAATGAAIDLTQDELMERALELEAITGLSLLPSVIGLDEEEPLKLGRLRL